MCYRASDRTGRDSAHTKGVAPGLPFRALRALAIASQKEHASVEYRARVFFGRIALVRISDRCLHRLEQVRNSHTQTQGNSVQRLNRSRVLAQLDLREVSKRNACSLGHLSQREAQALAAFADGGAEL